MEKIKDSENNLEKKLGKASEKLKKKIEKYTEKFVIIWKIIINPENNSRKNRKNIGKYQKKIGKI